MSSDIIPINLVSEMKTAYGDYALAVLVGRAIPDLYDGLKPVTRRVLTAMKWLNLRPDGKFMKCARVDGEVLGKLHPHGSSYGALVTVAQDFNNNHTYVNGHGNFGSPVDNPAAPRYTECKLTEFAWDVLLDDFGVCETRDNYDGSFQEPVRLETKVPTVLLNGIEGIGVGFATKIAPYNLREVCKAVELVAKGKEADAAYTLVPDFPSGCDIVRDDAITSQSETGTGSVRLRARVTEGVEERSGRAKDRVTLTFTNLPFQTNTESIGQQIKAGLEQGKIANIAEVRDESDREGDRLVVVLKPNVPAKDVLPYVFQYTDLDTKFSCKSLFIDGTKPVELSPVQVVKKWLAHRTERLVVKFTKESDKLTARVHILEGLLKAIDSLDLVIKLIREAKDKSDAKAKLMSNRSLKLTADQADAVLEMRLRQLTNLDSQEITDERDAHTSRLAELKTLLDKPEARVSYVITETKQIAKKFGFERRSQLVPIPDSPLQKKAEGGQKTVRVVKTRCIKIDMKKGVVEQLKGPRGANIVTQTDKFLVFGENGVFKKLPPTFKGPIFETATSIVLRGTEQEISSRKYALLFELDGALKGVCLSGEDLVKTTSKGKRFLPEDAKLVHLSEDVYTVEFKSARKKDKVVTLGDLKAGKPGSKGVNIAKLADLK